LESLGPRFSTVHRSSRSFLVTFSFQFGNMLTELRIIPKCYCPHAWRRKVCNLLIQPPLIAHANLYFSHNVYNTLYLKTTDRGALVSLWSKFQILSNFFWPVSISRLLEPPVINLWLSRTGKYIPHFCQVRETAIASGNRCMGKSACIPGPLF